VQENHDDTKILNSGVSATESLGAFEYGKHVGIAFQLVDDLLDFVASADQLGIGRANPFLFIKNKRLLTSSEGFSTLEKCPDMLSEGNAAHPVGCDSPVQIVMAVWRPFCLNSNFLGRV
jgi:hypothetical protein